MAERLKNEDLSYKDIFNISFEIYRHNLKPVMLFTLLIFVPYYIMEFLVLTPDVIIAFWDDFSDYFSVLLEGGSYLSDIPRSVFIVFGLTLTESLLFMPLAAGGLTGFVMAILEKGRADFEDCLTGSVRKIYKIIPTTIIMYIVVMSGVSLFIVPGIYFGVLYAFCPHAMVVTGRWGIGALRESSHASFGKWFKTLGFLTLVYAFDSAYTYLAQSVITAVFHIIPYSGLLSACLSLLFSAFSMYLYMVQCAWFINKYNMFIKLRNRR